MWAGEHGQVNVNVDRLVWTGECGQVNEWVPFPSEGHSLRIISLYSSRAVLFVVTASGCFIWSGAAHTDQPFSWPLACLC